MTLTRQIVAPLVLGLMLASSAAACGGSSTPNDAAARQKLQVDVKPLSSLGTTTDLTQLQTDLNSVAGKLKSDAKQGDSTLQSGVNQLVDVLDKLLSDAKAKNVNAAKSDISGLESAASKIGQACPNASASSSG